MRRLKLALSCALLAALTGVAVQAILLLHAATLATRALGEGVSAELRATRTDLVGQVAETRKVADQRIGDTLAHVDTALGKIEELRGDLKPVFDHAASITRQVDDAAPLFLDCEFNQDCVFNRYVGASKGVERAAMNFGQMSADVQTALPTAIKTWQGIGTNMGAITANVNRLTTPHWYDRVLGYGLNGVVIYRNLNPATNLIVKGAQVISSRP